MKLEQSEYADVTIHARNVGGIGETTVTFDSGVTVLVGRNATNRTSFLQAVMAALGSENVAIKGDAEEAEVELTLGNETYTRQLSRRSGDVRSDGDPYLDDPELADLFAFLLESNEARRAVATNGDLRELIMRPVDTEEIQAEIDRLLKQRESLESELEEITELKGELPELEADRSRLEEQIEEKRSQLEAKEAELDAADANVEETREEKSELDDRLEELRGRRSELDDVRYDLETERESLAALQQERRELELELEELSETPVGETEELNAEIQRLREQKSRLESAVNELQSVIGFNEEMLTGAGVDPFDELSGGMDTGTETVTDQLVDDGVTCWTCGSEVERDQIETTIDRLQELSQTKIGEIADIDDRISELQSEKRELEQAQRDREQTQRRLDELATEVDRTERTIETLQDRREELAEEIETIEQEVEALESEDYSEILDLHKEANQFEYELERLQTELDQVESEIADFERRLETQDDVETRLEGVNAEIESLRTKIDRIEQASVEQFNEHMDTVLELLDYANLERIWIERVEREVRQGRRKETESAFELHVVRSSESGVAYEDTLDHLSESEREVTGLVFGLAGYLAHEVYESVPFILLDSLEAIDSERIATLVEYLTEYTGYLLVALLPEDAAALSEDYERITEI